MKKLQGKNLKKIFKKQEETLLKLMQILKVKKLINFKPKKFKKGLNNFINWYKKKKLLIKIKILKKLFVKLNILNLNLSKKFQAYL